MKKITVIIENEDKKQHVGHLELDEETLEYFHLIGQDAINEAVLNMIRQMLEKEVV